MSPSRKQIVFYSGAARAIQIVSADGTRRHVLRKTSAGANPTFSPNGRRIVFTEGRDIVLIDLRGHVVRRFRGIRLTTPDVAVGSLLFGVRDFAPAWFPDSRRLVFARPVAEEATVRQLVTLDTVTASATVVVEGSRVAAPRVSPDGITIAYQRGGGFNGPSSFSLVDSDGSNNRVITPRRTAPLDAVFQPTFSPGGKWIAFVHQGEPGAGAELAIIRPDGTGQRALTSRWPVLGLPAWDS